MSPCQQVQQQAQLHAQLQAQHQMASGLNPNQMPAGYNHMPPGINPFAQHLGNPAAGAYPRPLLSSTSAVSDTKYTPDTPFYPLTPPRYLLNDPCTQPIFHRKRSR